MKKKHQWYGYGVLIAAMVAYAVTHGWQNSPPQTPVEHVATPSGIRATVKFVIDGDTIELEDGKRVRYIGIDTPEIDYEHNIVSCEAYNAREANRKLVDGKDVLLVPDVSNTDSYGRLLRYVYADDVFVNDVIIRKGYAYTLSIAPDTKYRSSFQDAQTVAKNSKIGIWSDTCQKE